LNKAIATVVVLIVAVGAWLWWPSEEGRIRRRLTEIAARLSVPANEPDLARVTRIAGLREYLAPSLRVRYGDQTAASRETILGALTQWGRSAEGVTVEFVDMQVTVSNHDVATVYMTVTVTSGDTIDAREVDVRLANNGSAVQAEWLVTSAESRETLSK
jgi:hypothetical protein